MNPKPVALVLMGVSGCGKTAVGERLAEITGWPFYDGDDFHPEENVAKMAAGVPLDDQDRVPWLDHLHHLIKDHLQAGKSVLLACSALKQAYRDRLTGDNQGTIFVFLKGDFELIFARMQSRAGHYMKAGMLQSQFESLEEPVDAVVVDISQSLEQVVAAILDRLA